MPQIELKVGRSPESDIRLDDDSVSNKHAEIELTEDGRLFVVDCHSTNGTYMDAGDKEQIRIEQSLVPAEAVIFFGLSEHRATDLINLVMAHEKLLQAKSGSGR